MPGEIEALAAKLRKKRPHLILRKSEAVESLDDALDYISTSDLNSGDVVGVINLETMKITSPKELWALIEDDE